MLLPIDRDENNLFFAKRLQMMNKAIGNSYASNIMNSIEIFSKYQVHETESVKRKWRNIFWTVRLLQ